MAASYAGNDEAAQRFKADTGIPVFKWDVGDYDACASGVRQVEAEVGPVDVLVNNAGITRDGFFHKMSREQWSAVIRTNLDSLFNMTRPVIEGMRDARLGAGDRDLAPSTGRRARRARSTTRPPRPATSASSRRWRRRARNKGITVNAICPGYIGTEMVQAIDPEVLWTKIIPLIPVGRLGQPEEIARAVVFLAGEEGGFITGSTFSINGGQYMM